MICFADIEADGLDPTKIHVMVIKCDRGTRCIFDKKDFHRTVKEWGITSWVFHNGLNYDVPVLNKLWDAGIDYKKVVDTMVVSKTVAYSKFNTHSLKEIGEKLGVFKGEFKGDWSVYSDEMRDYCIQDVEVVEAIFNHYKPMIYDKQWKDALRLEHDTAWLCKEMTDNGFYFDKENAEKLLKDITDDMETLEASFRSGIGKVLKETKRLKERYKKDGSLYDNVLVAIAEADQVELVNGEYIIYNYEPFNPGSPKQRIDVLWDHGWRPFEKTKGHIKYLRENK